MGLSKGGLNKNMDEIQVKIKYHEVTTSACVFL
ncbi:hypothetical protein GAB14E_2158 [Colwellia psychrerythraea]|uniref:Uncharacterized protein n=1 Tax=Colwellia psychrerythraea TaxID=28229 RepID=A0A099KW06_COLPS|nr:hypothetical protein GAB14E_2158 [Colwellia psychrerythraea]